MSGEGPGEQVLGGPSVNPVPVALTLDAARGRRLVPQPGLGDAPVAALADPVRALAQLLQRPLDLLAVLVQQVDQDVAGLAVGQRLGKVGLLGDAGDHTADHLVERPVEPGLLAALRRQELEPSPVSFQPLLWSGSRPLGGHLQTPLQTHYRIRRRLDSESQNACIRMRTRSRTISRRMRTPLPIPRKVLAVLALLAFAGCQPGNSPRPVPSVPQIGADLKCGQGDHGYEDPQAGWGFCYPGTWRYTERAQSSQSPVGLDLTFDITYAPPTPAP